MIQLVGYWPQYLEQRRIKCPLETAVPYAAFKQAGFDVQFATENGKVPECDRMMLRGITQKLLVSSIPVDLLIYMC